MKPLFNRTHKIYNDKDEKEPSLVNRYIEARDGIVKRISYRNSAGYGSFAELYLCEDVKHESVAIIRRTVIDGEWIEEAMYFEADEFEFIEQLMSNEPKPSWGKYELIRDYMNE